MSALTLQGTSPALGNLYRENRGNTELAGYIWDLKDSNIPFSITWDILGRAPAYNPVTKTCRLCTLEKFFILYHPSKSSLNQRTEVFSPCPHRETDTSFFLVGKIVKIEIFHFQLSSFRFCCHPYEFMYWAVTLATEE